MYRPPWPTQLDSAHEWEVEQDWERHIGDRVDRLVAAGRLERKFAKNLSRRPRAAASNAWKIARRLGAELFDLKGRFRVINIKATKAEENEKMLTSDKDWDTSTWSNLDLAISADTLVKIFQSEPGPNVDKRQSVAVYLLKVLLGRHPEFMLPYLEKLVDKLLDRATRVPVFSTDAPDPIAVTFLAHLAPFMSDKLIRSLGMNRLVASAMFELNLCARRIQQRWALFRYVKYERESLVPRAQRRREINLGLCRYWLQHGWSWMKRSEHQGVIPSGTLQAMLGLIAAMVAPNNPGRKKNSIRLEQGGGVFFVSKLMTHSHRGIREQAARVILHLAMTTWFRPTLLANRVVSQMLQLMHGSKYSFDDLRSRLPAGEDDGAPLEPASVSPSKVLKHDWFVEPCLEDRLQALEILDLMCKGIGPLGKAGGAGDEGGASDADAPEGDDITSSESDAQEETFADGFTPSNPKAKEKPRRKPRRRGEEESNPLFAEKKVRPRENFEIGWDSEDSAEGRWDSDEDRKLRARVGTGEGFFGVERTYEEKVAILKNRRALKQGQPAPTLSHERIRRRLRYLKVVREEQGDRVVDTPPLYPVPLEKFGKFNVTKPYFIAIARSEPILGIEGPEYWDVVASPEMLRRLVQLLSATDSSTRLGAAMALSKLVSRDALVDRVCKACCRRPECFDSMVGSLAREEPIASTATMIFLRKLLAHERCRSRVLRTTLVPSLLAVCEGRPPHSLATILCMHCVIAFAFPYAHGPSEDALPLDMSATYGELTMALNRTFLQLLLTSEEQRQATLTAMVQLNAVPAVVRFSCQCVDFDQIGLDVSALMKDWMGDSVVVGGEDEDEDGMGAMLRTGDSKFATLSMASLTDDKSDVDKVPEKLDPGYPPVEKEKPHDAEPDKLKLDGESSDPTVAAVVDAILSDVPAAVEPVEDLVADAKGMGAEDAKSIDSAEDLRDDGVFDFGKTGTAAEDDAPTPRFVDSTGTTDPSGSGDEFDLLDTTAIDAAEIRYVSAVFLEKLSGSPDCIATVCTEESVSHLVGVLRQSFQELNDSTGRESFETIDQLTLSMQACCRALTNFSSSKVLSPAAKELVVRAVLEVGAIVDIAYMFTSEWTEASRHRLSRIRQAKVDAIEAAEKARADAELALVSPPAGSAKEQKAAMKAAQVHAVDAARAAELAKHAYTRAKQRRRDDEETTECAASLVCSTIPRLPDVLEDELDRFAGSGDPDEVKTAEDRLMENLIKYYNPEAPPPAVRQVPKPVTVSDDIDPLVYNAVLTVGPQLIGLVPRTENPAIRSVALLTLARLAYTPATAKLLIRLGAFQMILAFFPYCKSPEILSVEPDMLDTAAFPSFEPFPTRVPMARRSDPRASGTGVPTKDDVASAGLPASKQSPLLFGNLPVTLFTFIASLSRCAPFRGDICASGLLSACVDRFVLETGDPNVDIKVQAELAILFARVASRAFPGFGAANDTILGKQRTCNPETLAKYRFRMLESCGDDQLMSAHLDPRDSPTVNLVVAGLTNLVGLRSHPRLLYHGILCLANLAQDTARAVPILVEEGLITAIVPILKDYDAPALVVRHVIRCISCVALGCTADVRRRMVQLRVLVHLQRIGMDCPRIEAEKAAGWRYSCPELARLAIDNLGDDFVSESAALSRFDAQSSSAYLPRASSSLFAPSSSSPSRSIREGDSVEFGRTSLLLSSSLSSSTLPAVQNLVRHLNSTSKPKAPPSYRRVADSPVTFPTLAAGTMSPAKPAVSGSNSAKIAAPATPGLSGFLFDPVFGAQAEPTFAVSPSKPLPSQGQSVQQVLKATSSPKTRASSSRRSHGK